MLQLGTCITSCNYDVKVVCTTSYNGSFFCLCRCDLILDNDRTMKSKTKRKALKSIIAVLAYKTTQKKEKRYWTKEWLTKRTELGNFTVK